MTTPAQTESTEAQAPGNVVLTDVAAEKVKALIEQEGRDDLRLRVAVQPGGCSGLQYQLFFDERSSTVTWSPTFGGVEVVVDRMSAPYLTGATIDFADRIDAQGFTIDNPNARRLLRLRRLVPLSRRSTLDRRGHLGDPGVRLACAQSFSIDDRGSVRAANR